MRKDLKLIKPDREPQVVREIETAKRPILALSVVYGRLKTWLSLGSIASRWQVTAGEIEEAERQRRELER